MKKIILAALLLTATLMACEQNIPGPAPSENFDAIIAAGGAFEQVSKSEEVLETSESYNVEDGEEYVCTTETLKIEDAAGGNSGFPLFNPNSSVVYPGSLLQGNSLNQATPNIIAVKRSGGTISTDVFDGSIAPSFEVDEVKISSVTEAANSIIRNSTGVVPANFEFSYDLVQSKREMALKMKAQYETKFTEIEGKLEFSSDRSYNRMLITLNQSFYTLRFDIPTSTDQIFAPEVTPQDLERYVGPGNPAAYISSVTYGRIYYMLIE
ncbi:MAG: thiol-activated cytolysin family protein, partial [Bacteroidota bacterium]